MSLNMASRNIRICLVFSNSPSFKFKFLLEMKTQL